MKTVCKASFFHLICIFFFFRIMERIAKNTKPTIQALGRACKKYPKTLPLFISILKKLYISKNISSSPNSDLPVSFTAAKSIISCVSIQSNKKMDRRKSVMEFSEHWQDLLRFSLNNFALTVRGGFCWLFYLCADLLCCRSAFLLICPYASKAFPPQLLS